MKRHTDEQRFVHRLEAIWRNLPTIRLPIRRVIRRRGKTFVVAKRCVVGTFTGRPKT